MISDRKNVVIFYVQVTLMLLANFKSIGLLVQEKKQKLIFKTAPWRLSWNSDRNNISNY